MQTTPPTVAPPIGREGLIADSGTKHVDSRLVELAAGLKAGRVVVKGTGDQQVLLPTTTGEVTGGTARITLYDAMHEPFSPSTDTEYGDKQAVPALRRGQVWMLAEDAVAPGGDVFVRFVATGGEELGRVRSDADGGDAVALPGAAFDTTTSGTDELVIVSYNSPA